MFFAALLAVASLTAWAQGGSYIVKTSNVKKAEPTVVGDSAQAAAATQQAAAQKRDFISENFRFYSLCDWEPGMKFLVMPEKYDLIVKTFRTASDGKEVSSMPLRHKVMVYTGHSQTAEGHARVDFHCEDNNTDYYYEIPSGSFDDYCYGKLGVPTLAYMGDVDIAREKLVGRTLITQQTVFRIDTESDGDGYREIIYPKNREVEVVAVGAGSRSFPAKIIVKDKEGREFYQTIAMSKTNSGMRDDEFIMDSLKHTFYGSFKLVGEMMHLSGDYASYVNKTVHNKYATSMTTKGDGKERTVKVPRLTTFRIDAMVADHDGEHIVMTLTESESRRVYNKRVRFKEMDVTGLSEAEKDEVFPYVFDEGEGISRETNTETRAAIRAGRVIPGMSEDEVMLTLGEPDNTVSSSTGRYDWIYRRSKSLLVVQFGAAGKVVAYKVNGVTQTSGTKKKTTARKRTSTARRRTSTATRRSSSSGWQSRNGTPL